MRALSKIEREVDFSFATPADVPALNTLFQAFFDESVYPSFDIAYSPEKAAKWMELAISIGACPHLLARHKSDGRILGVLSYHIDQSFSVAPIAILNVLYVIPAWRRSALGRALVLQAVDVAKAVDGCTVMTAPITSGLEATLSLRNMMLKLGFADAGILLRRTL